MNSAPRPRYLEVLLYGQLCGYLCELGGHCRFVPSEAFKAADAEPTLSLSMAVPGSPAIAAEIFANPFHPALYNTGGRLPPFFAGLLPESELRQRLEATRHNPEDRDDFGVLSAAGEDLPGAVVVRPPRDPYDIPEYARTFGVTGGADNVEMSVIEGAAEGAASVSGVQNKLALSTVQKGKRYTMPGHGTLSDVIAKLPARNDDSQVFNEYVAMQLAKAAGVDVAACEPMPLSAIAIDGLAEVAGSATSFLAVERYDRRANERIHVEDACQMLGRMPSAKYAKADQYQVLVRFLKALSPRGARDIREFFVRQTVNTLIGNSDAHLKNFSVLYADRLHPQLTPAYDIVCVSALPGFATYGTNVAIDQAQRVQTLDDYKAMARAAGVAERIATAAVKAAVEAAKERWPAMLDDLPAPRGMKGIVLERLGSLPLARG
ncbi:HipA domain-containing protein [Paraburkholderia sp. D15]|uniref:type II toxin-antitoxin system HipA family toxin n=1 Tax=Paraburkholderia sp. D15 TaxID=2880218 RepID=UPI0024794B1B|nr:HipA domain-containing protein [Paraburkholderia sp. D15]WGS52976.1 HipA domain-containing protein [Paraburkholderia sp. D15]